MSGRVFLVTGAMGCIGAWAVLHLLRRGERVVSFDLSENRARLDLLIPREAQRAITFVTGDLAQPGAVAQAVQAHSVAHIIHLAALQVPFCRANPVVGAQVNVVGTVNVFEAARLAGIAHLAHASSIAIYGPASLYPPGLIAHEAAPAPGTLYGVYKLADEGIARVYWAEHGIGSTALRPYTVYGLGRDQGVTSEPTLALAAAARGEAGHISFNSPMQFQWASDVAEQFIDAATLPLNGAFGFNLGGPSITPAQFADAVREQVPGAGVTVGDRALPFPHGFDDAVLRAHFPVVYETPLAQGIAHTLAGLRSPANR